MLFRFLFLVVPILTPCTEAWSQGNVFLSLTPKIMYQTVQGNWNLIPGKVKSVTEAQASGRFTNISFEGTSQYSLQVGGQAKNTGVKPVAIQVIKSAQVSTPTLDFSTYIGGSNWEHIRDVFADSQGNIYITGGTASSDFPTTPGVYDRTFDSGGMYLGSAGPCDVFVAKFGPSGNLIWSTYLGGPNYDRAYGIEVDDQGYVYVAGRAGPGFPVTASAFQTTFQGVDAGIYGMENAFVAKLSPDGSHLVWASYVGVGSGCRDLAIDDNGDVYVPLIYSGSGGTPPAAWFTNAFQKILKGGKECGAVKIKGDGSQVIWATWLGGTADDYGTASIRVDTSGYVYIAIPTSSNDIPTTPGAFDQTYNGGVDLYVAKLTPDGSDLVYGTYLGDSGDNWTNTHNLALDEQGNAYVSICATNSGFPTTPGAFRRIYGGGSIDIGVVKLSPTGALIASTFIGGNGWDNPDGIYVDASGNVYLSGATGSTNFPVTGDAYQSNNKGGLDAVWVELSADFSQLFYSTYMGGGSDDEARTSFLGQDGNMYLAGQSSGTGWPIKNAFQNSYAGGRLDATVAKFTFSYTVPIGLESFTANVTYNSVELTWKTASESNNLGFEVERGQDRTHFTKIGFVAGQRTTARSHDYRFVDKNLLSGIYYYRLKQIDNDGRFEYSSIVEVVIDLPGKFMLYQNYPNPFNATTSIKYYIPKLSHVKLVIMNLRGQEIACLVDTLQQAGNYNELWEASGVASGIYLYKLQAGEFIQIRKMLLIK